ncbi:hypothetical protein TNCT_696351 [Trichonephila clavata]|uniref:Uncharacterized protein n=1 Tax=Trichonephila clavata TaxID=2740835 RepID=A0A8X6FDX5_TRICU|nr:hypothetical protein TNCT_696351 [Trichonephila clavata]
MYRHWQYTGSYGEDGEFDRITGAQPLTIQRHDERYRYKTARFILSHRNSKAEEVRTFQNPFEADMVSCLDELQVEVNELQAKDHLRNKFKEELVGFYQFLT